MPTTIFDVFLKNISGEDNNAFVADEDNEADNEDEAVQAKVLPWKKD